MLTNVLGDAHAELVTGRGLRHAADVAADEAHGVLSVAVQKTVATIGLRGGAVDDGNKVRGDDDAVLAFLCGVLRDDGLLYDGHDEWG